MLARSGRMTQEELLDALGRTMATSENNPGRLFQSATASSRETWTQGPFGRKEGRVRKTISYYEKGPVLGMLLDFRIRHETRNQRSLDTVMRTLYEKYYKELGRGWTDEGVPRDVRARGRRSSRRELRLRWTTRRSTREVSRLRRARARAWPSTGRRPLPVRSSRIATAGSSLPADAPRSPSAETLLSDDVSVEVDGARLDAERFDGRRRPSPGRPPSPDDRAERKASSTCRLALGHRVERTFRIKPAAAPSALQAAILNSWVQAPGR